MNDARNHTGKKRKRRSFWEPESQKVAAWLDAQTDLGTSLQLVIVDAIRKYGEGDAIKAHLSQRENAAFDWERQQGQPIQPSMPVQENLVQKQAPQTASTPVPEPESEPTLPIDFGPEIEDFEEPELPETPSQQDEPEFDVASAIAGAMGQEDDDPNSDNDQEDSYNPLDIMMRDIGSTINK